MTDRERRQVGRPATIEAPRETILAHAASLFATMGYENTSLQDVARAVGISKAAVYHYFSTKQQIYDEIVVVMLQQLEAFVRERVEKAERSEDGIRAFMVAHATFMEENFTEFVTLLHGHGGTSRVRSPGEIAARDSYETVLRTMLQQAQDRGELNIDNVASASRAILSMLNWMSRWFRPDGERRAAEFAEDYFKLLYMGFKRR
ncbi:transcriptional regulator, TetR family [Xaviernesmea oryzae]|uniref:Transcriptional regulator, TetR family n=1 Tax=Xaviernesmea oryzae TaxID=464029 RepID=A0A1X7FQ62_9HYPH|nr:TetR/AcrR family transcriptional regulator [Xaviernesmea oryzae]SMF56602.1 transcriptional regulator, TetR family [Xaviernesmea oryzae]